jgi:hypothetical protein
LFAAALWWGSLGAIGFMAVPALVANAASPTVAGQLAARLFTAQTWLSLGCGVVLLYGVRPQSVDDEPPTLSPSNRALLGWVLGGLILDLLLEFAAAPRIRARENLAVWHAAGSAMFLLQWLCAGASLWKLSRACAS